MRLGVDLDNTLIFLDNLFFQRAVAWGWMAVQPELDKTTLRQTLRQRPGGEMLWRQLQAEVYGPALHQAPLMDGAENFLRRCQQQQITVFIVSHKTHFAGPYDIRATATAWLEQNIFFQLTGFALLGEHVFFEASREEKLARIGKLGLDYFIDDLPEVLCHPAFPPAVRPIWFNPAGQPGLAGIPSCRHWLEITRHVFGDE